MSNRPTRSLASLEATLEQLTSDSKLAASWFGKSALIALLSRSLGDGATVGFERIRAAAKTTGTLGTTSIRCQGERRGTKYAFGRAATLCDSSPAQAIPISPGVNAAPTGLRDFPAPARPIGAGRLEIHHGDNQEILRGFADASFDLIYIDPPFNTGRAQSRTRIKTERDAEGDRVGFQGRRYRTTVVGASSYADSFDDYMAFLIPRLEEAHRLLKPGGSFFLHLDYREVHYAKVALDQIFGRASFINEIIWAYDYGARATNRWSPKHDNILWYAKNPSDYCFNYDEIDRIPYMAPGLVGAEKAERGKTPTDAWWNTIVSPNGREKTGYPTQKPLGILTRIVRVHSNPGDRLLDFFAGSGSFGEAGASLGRDVTLVDESAEAIEVMRRRFGNYSVTFAISSEMGNRRRDKSADNHDAIPFERADSSTPKTPTNKQVAVVQKSLFE